MSRTDKDRPPWVVIVSEGRSGHRHRDAEGRHVACDADGTWWAAKRPDGSLGCFPVLPLTRPAWWRYSTAPPKADRALLFHRRERSRARMATSRLRREFNAAGELVDGDVFCRQHRNGLRWDRW